MTVRGQPFTDQPGTATNEQRALTITLDLDQIAKLLAPLLAEHITSALSTSSSPWLDVEAAASYLSCSSERIRKLVGRREIPFHQARAGGRVFLHRSELDEWLLNL